MSKFVSSVFAFALCFCAFTSTAKAQGNPLKNIPIDGTIAGLTDATFSIDAFFVRNNAMYISSTFKANGGAFLVPDVEALVELDNASCEQLTLRIISTTLPVVDITFSKDNFVISPFTVVASIKKQNDNRLKNAFCSIAELRKSNASLNAVVAHLKAAIRAY